MSDSLRITLARLGNYCFHCTQRLWVLRNLIAVFPLCKRYIATVHCYFYQSPHICSHLKFIADDSWLGTRIWSYNKLSSTINKVQCTNSYTSIFRELFSPCRRGAVTLYAC